MYTQMNKAKTTHYMSLNIQSHKNTELIKFYIVSYTLLISVLVVHVVHNRYSKFDCAVVDCRFTFHFTLMIFSIVTDDCGLYFFKDFRYCVIRAPKSHLPVKLTEPLGTATTIAHEVQGSLRL
jgi:hypothetical protein